MRLDEKRPHARQMLRIRHSLLDLVLRQDSSDGWGSPILVCPSGGGLADLVVDLGARQEHILLAEGLFEDLVDRLLGIFVS